MPRSLRRRHVEEERARAFKAAEARRRRQEAFATREKRRMQFVEAVHEQLLDRAKLSVVMSHVEIITTDDANHLQEMITWLGRRIQQIDALIGPQFLDISSRAAKVNFEEPGSGSNAADERYPGYLPPVTLQFWSIDEDRGWPARSRPSSGSSTLGLLRTLASTQRDPQRRSSDRPRHRQTPSNR
jgi:hypothetical protein